MDVNGKKTKAKVVAGNREAELAKGQAFTFSHITLFTRRSPLSNGRRPSVAKVEPSPTDSSRGFVPTPPAIDAPEEKSR